MIVLEHDDPTGKALNPHKKTGYLGRGLLWYWGVNETVDAMVTRRNSHTGKLQMLRVIRGDNGMPATPGGFKNKGESAKKAAARELQEETGVEVDFTGAIKVYKGYADDTRNTDHAWIETTALWKHLPWEIAEKMVPVAGDDARSAEWVDIEEFHPGDWHASNGEMIGRLLALWRSMPTMESSRIKQFLLADVVSLLHMPRVLLERGITAFASYLVKNFHAFMLVPHYLADSAMLSRFA